MRTEFTAATKRQAWMRAEGRCQHPDCAKKLFPGDIFYDHIIPDALGGDNTLSNCQVLCRAHHDPKTRKDDVPRIAKMKRQRDKHNGIKSTTRPLPGSKASGWRHRMDGTWEKRT